MYNNWLRPLYFNKLSNVLVNSLRSESKLLEHIKFYDESSFQELKKEIVKRALPFSKRYTSLLSLLLSLTILINLLNTVIVLLNLVK
jgi:hypothetical protein